MTPMPWLVVMLASHRWSSTSALGPHSFQLCCAARLKHRTTISHPSLSVRVFCADLRGHFRCLSSSAVVSATGGLLLLARAWLLFSPGVGLAFGGSDPWSGSWLVWWPPWRGLSDWAALT